MAETSKPEAGQGTKAPRDLRQELTDKLVQSLDQGQIPWNKPWNALKVGLPRNMETGREYRGGNRFMLMLEQADRGFTDPRYGTVKQINALGGRVKKGEHGMPVELWKEQPFYERKDVSVTLNGMRVKVFGEQKGMAAVGMPTDKDATLNVKTSDLRVQHESKQGRVELSWAKAHELDTWVSRVHTVFNVAQCDGLKIEPLAPAPNFDPVARGESIKAAMEKDGLKFAEHPEHAFYSPKRDEVSLPPRSAFNSQLGNEEGAARYYGTLLHEIGHATGAQHRLNRDGITGGHRFGSEGYAKEELRAEMFSMFTAAQTGIPHDTERHTAYVQDWVEVLKNDKNEIFRAAAEAGKAVDYVLAKEQSLQVTQERQASAKAAELAADAAKPFVTMHEALEDAGWRYKPTTGVHEKTFVLTKDKSKGGEFTRGHTEVEKILIAKPVASGFVIEHGWDDVPVPVPAGTDKREAVRMLDAAAKDRLAKEHADLGVVAIRGRDEQPEPPMGQTKAVGNGASMGQPVTHEDALLSKEPHELTFDAFSAVARVQKLGPGHGRQWEVFHGKESLGFADGPTEQGALRQVHERQVNNALYGNQPDSPDFLRKSMPPPEVLAEYPGLQKLWARVIDAKQPGADVAQQPIPQPGDAKAEQAPEIQSAVFWRKVQDADHIAAIGRDVAYVDPVVIDRKLDLTPEAYDELTTDLMDNHPAIAGAGGTDEQGRRVVVDVNAPGRQRLLIDPQGYDYARYVGIPEQDVEALLARKSFVTAPEVEQSRVQAEPGQAPATDLSEKQKDAAWSRLMDREEARFEGADRTPGPYETAIANFVKGGGNEKDARRILDSELAGDYDPKHLPTALVYHGFAKPSQAEKLASDIIAEDNQKMLDKEDRKSSEYHVAKQAEEAEKAAGKDKARVAEPAPDKSAESSEGDKPERPVRPRLRQTNRKAAAMER